MDTKIFNIKHIFGYAIITLIINYIASSVGTGLPLAVLQWWVDNFGGLSAFAQYFWQFLIINPLILVISWGLLYWYIKYLLFKIKINKDSENAWLKNSLRLVCFGEIFRFILCAFRLGILNSTGVFSSIATVCFEIFYFKIFPNRRFPVRHLGNFIFMDYVGYTLAYLLYFIPYFFVLILICKFCWKKRLENNDLIV